MESCILIPTVLVGTEEKESKLFRDLLSLTGNRESTKYIWGLTQVPEFMNEITGIVKDENGEPTIESLNKVLNIKELLEGKLSLLGEKQLLGATDKLGEPILYKSTRQIINRVIEFNKNNSELVANIEKADGGYIISVNNRTLDNIEVPSQIVFKNNLNNNLLGIMRRLGFDVAINESMEHDGMFTPLNAEENALGLRTIILIAKGERGEDAFPEEFSHFIIEGLSHHPLVSRLLNNLLDIGTIQIILGSDFDSYNEMHKGNLYLLQKEAAGKLLQSHITGTNSYAPVLSLLTRIWNWVKSKFGSISDIDIDEAIIEANDAAAQLASSIKDESIIPLIDKDAVLAGPTLYRVGREVNKAKEIAELALEVASKRLRIVQSRSKLGRYSDEDLSSIKNLQNLIEKKKYSKSCLAFLIDSLKQIEQLDKDLTALKTSDLREDSDLRKIKRISHILRNIKEFSDGYTPIILTMMRMSYMQKNNEVDLTEEDAELITLEASRVFLIINNISSNYRDLRFNTVLNFLKIYWGEDKIIDVGKHKGERIVLEKILEKADKDINGIDRWLSAMGDASDPVLSLIDKAVKISMANRDRILEEIAAEIRGAHLKLTNAGYTTDFMYERDENGKLTGRLISDIDFVKFNKERQAYIKTLKDKKLEHYQIKSKVEAWERRRTERIIIDKETGRSEMLPSKALYGRDFLSSLSAEQKEYYDKMMKAKALLDDLLPARYTNTFKAVLIRNDMLENILDNISDPKKAARIALENMKDHFIRRSDDTEFGESEELPGMLEKVKNINLGFDNKPLAKLPVYYTLELEDMDRLSTDFTSSLLAYAGMAVNYSEMNKIVDAVELTRDLVHDREVQQYSGDAKMIEAYRSVRKSFSKSYTKPGLSSNIGGKLDDYIEKVMYGRSKLDEGSVNVFGNEVDKAKTLDALKDYTGKVGLGLNIFSAIGNVTAGKMQMFIESLGGEYFGLKNSAIGKKNYYALLPELLGEINSAKKTSKLALLIDKFDALEEFHSNLRRTNYYLGPISRIIGSANLFILNNAGEHYLHSRTMLAMLDAYKVKDSSGKELSLFEAFEVEHIKDENGKTISARLKIKDGVTKINGEAITDSDISEIKLKIGKVNLSLNGAFNEVDKGAIHKYALGRLAMLFRLWMPAHYGRRFAGAHYDAVLEQYREGYYRTLGRFSINLIKDLARAKFELATHWDLLSPHEKANIKRALAEIEIFCSLSAAIAMMGPAKDKKGVWGDRMLLYSLKRMKLEAGASMPLNPPGFLSNIWTILQSPAASLNTLENIGNLVLVWNIFNEIESGRYKGWSEYERDLSKTLIIYGQVRKAIDITTEDYMFKIFDM